MWAKLVACNMTVDLVVTGPLTAHACHLAGRLHFPVPCRIQSMALWKDIP